jgi:pimeloyl-ACP methyl ester carboxylesterase
MSLYVEEHGEGFPLLLIQGLGYATWAWRHQLGPFSERFRVIAFDNRGAGRSEKTPGPYSIEGLADDAVGVLQGRRAHVLGISMGGYIAQTLALRHPELVERLVLGCTGSGGPENVTTPKATTDEWEAHAHLPTPEFARATMHLSFAPGWADEHPEELEDLLAARLEFSTPMEAWRAQYDACWGFVGRVSPLERIEAPTLVLHGDADRIVPYENGLHLARRIPHTELVTFPGTGHLLFLERPREFNEAVLRFLSP